MLYLTVTVELYYNFCLNVVSGNNLLNIHYLIIIHLNYSLTLCVGIDDNIIYKYNLICIQL